MKTKIAICLLFLSCLLMSSCGGSGSSTVTNPPVPSGVAPTIVTPPQNQTVVQGQSANFSVVASGDSLNYQWTRNGAAAGSNSPAFQIDNTTSADNGSTVGVSVSNPQGTVVAQATLSVEVPNNPGGGDTTPPVYVGETTTICGIAGVTTSPCVLGFGANSCVVNSNQTSAICSPFTVTTTSNIGQGHAVLAVFYGTCVPGTNFQFSDQKGDSFSPIISNSYLQVALAMNVQGGSTNVTLTTTPPPNEGVNSISTDFCSSLGGVALREYSGVTEGLDSSAAVNIADTPIEQVSASLTTNVANETVVAFGVSDITTLLAGNGASNYANLFNGNNCNCSATGGGYSVEDAPAASAGNFTISFYNPTQGSAETFVAVYAISIY